MLGPFATTAFAGTPSNSGEHRSNNCHSSYIYEQPIEHKYFELASASGERDRPAPAIGVADTQFFFCTDKRKGRVWCSLQSMPGRIQNFSYDKAGPGNGIRTQVKAFTQIPESSRMA